jgi:membrane protein DedA with SNARE-associated domain
MTIFGKNLKYKPAQVVIFFCTTLAAILIISFTVGREFYEGRSESIFSFALIHFAGYLFFLLMPVEIAFCYYLSFYEEIEMIGVAMGTALAAQLIDYFIGYSFSKKFIQNFVGENRIAKSEKYIKKYGNLTLFLFNVLPLSSPVISLVAGMIKYRLKYLIIYSFFGLLIKYLILSYIF